MNNQSIDEIVGDMPEFLLKMELRKIAESDVCFGDSRDWTHFQGLDADGEKLLDAMVVAGLVDKGEAKPENGGATLCVYRLHA